VKPLPQAPPGWFNAVRTWTRHWDRASAELTRNPDSLRARLVKHTAHNRLVELMTQRPHAP
jgi:hypothetical protein